MKPALKHIKGIAKIGIMRVASLQFRLRTLLILVALLAIPCSYVARDVETVKERKAWLTDRRELEMFFMAGNGAANADSLYQRGDLSLHPSLIRIWLGDEPRTFLAFESSVPAAEMEAPMALFPEADVFIVPAFPDPDRGAPSGR